MSVFSDAQDRESTDAESLYAPLSRLLSLPEPFAIFEDSVGRRLEQWREHTLLAPLGFLLAVTHGVLELLLLLAVLSFRVYQLWKIEGSAHVLSVLGAVVGLLFPSSRRFGFSRLMERLVGPGFIEQRRFNSTVSGIFAPLNAHTRRQREFERQSQAWIAEVDSIAPSVAVEVFYETMGLVRVIADTLETAYTLSDEAYAQLKDSIKQAFQDGASQPTPPSTAAYAHHFLRILLCRLAARRVHLVTTLCADLPRLATTMEIFVLIFEIAEVFADEDNLRELADTCKEIAQTVQRRHDTFGMSTADPVHLAQILLSSTSTLFALPTAEHAGAPARLFEAYLEFRQAERNLVKAEEALFNSILAAILARNNYKTTVAEWRSARDS